MRAVSPSAVFAPRWTLSLKESPVLDATGHTLLPRSWATPPPMPRVLEPVLYGGCVQRRGPQSKTNGSWLREEATPGGAVTVVPLSVPLLAFCSVGIGAVHTRSQALCHSSHDQQLALKPAGGYGTGAGPSADEYGWQALVGELHTAGEGAEHLEPTPQRRGAFSPAYSNSTHKVCLKRAAIAFGEFEAGVTMGGCRHGRCSRQESTAAVRVHD
jgi:hypothetical protein